MYHMVGWGENDMVEDANRALKEFSDIFGDLGFAWGMPRDACRVHALIYVIASPVSVGDIGEVLDLSKDDVVQAIHFLTDFDLAWTLNGTTYSVHLDPWEALLTGLDNRRARDLPAMRQSLSAASQSLAGNTTSVAQVDKMIGLVDDMSAIHAQAFRLSPKLLRGMIGFSGRAARMLGGGKT
jgi:DNA-binding transcriptional regulator GbsR (MarR family)